VGLARALARKTAAPRVPATARSWAAASGAALGSPSVQESGSTTVQALEAALEEPSAPVTEQGWDTAMAWATELRSAMCSGSEP